MTSRLKRYIKQAQTFNVHIFDMKIPKYAIYGRQKDTYFYVNNFEQFKVKKEKYEIYLVTLKDDYFRKLYMTHKNSIMRDVISYVKEHNLYDIKCENPFGIKLERLFKEESRGNNKVNSYKTVQGDYYSASWFKRN